MMCQRGCFWKRLISTGIWNLSNEAQGWPVRAGASQLLWAWTEQKPGKSKWTLHLTWEVHLLLALDFRPPGLEAFLNFWTWTLGYTLPVFLLFQFPDGRWQGLYAPESHDLIPCYDLLYTHIQWGQIQLSLTSTCTQRYMPPPHLLTPAPPPLVPLPSKQ